MARYYVIGDIHGHLDLLERAHRLIAAHRKKVGDETAPVVHLGDLIDRGPASAEVVDYLMKGPTGPAPWLVLKGNHDRLFELFLEDPSLKDPGLRSDMGWLHPRVGGIETLTSYGLDNVANRAPRDLQAEALARVPTRHRAYLATRPLFHHADGLFFVHAGIRPEVALDAQDPQDLMWIRKDFHNHTEPHGAYIIHGHTAIDQPRHYGNRLNMDAGAAYGGPLAVVVIEDGVPSELTDDGPIPLPLSHWEKI